jgi:histidinol phosphatase-like PHP family hydrolase
MPETLIEAAIAGGIDMLGICDHNYGIGFGRKEIYKSESELSNDNYERTLKRYFDHMTLLKEKYADKIKILRGVEISTTLTRPRTLLPESTPVFFFDYALVEHIHPMENSAIGGDLFGFARRVGCPLGIAHTDLFAFIETIGEEPLSYLCRMAEAGIFWELNVSYDSTHNYIEHEYVGRFFASPEQQELVRRSGLRMSVGFDSHKAEEYRADRVRAACEKLASLGIPMMFE